MAQTSNPAVPTGDAALLAIAMGEAEGINPLSSADIVKKLQNLEKSFPPDYPMLITIISITLVTVVVLLLRWWTCWRCARFVLEDWLMMPACLSVCALAANTCQAMLSAGLGKHSWQLSYEEVTLLLPAIYAFMPIYILATFFTQLSIISLNFRITQRALFPFLWWIVRITLWHWVVWLPSATAAYLLQCLPVEANYKLHLRFESTTKCKDYVPVYIVMAFAHTLADFAILSVPVYLVLKAQVSRRKRCAALIFSGIGFVAALFSIVRVSFAVLYSRSSDMAFIASWIAYSSQFELALAMIATSLPKLRWLFPCSDRSGLRFTSTGNTGPRSRELATVAPNSPHPGGTCKDIELGDGLTRDDIRLVPRLGEFGKFQDQD